MYGLLVVSCMKCAICVTPLMLKASMVYQSKFWEALSLQLTTCIPRVCAILLAKCYK
jgi:hypothetical protein